MMFSKMDNIMASISSTNYSMPHKKCIFLSKLLRNFCVKGNVKNGLRAK